MDMLKGMNEAIQYIEEHLEQQIDLAEVAKRAYCSEYHFKRLLADKKDKTEIWVSVKKKN